MQGFGYARVRVCKGSRVQRLRCARFRVRVFQGLQLGCARVRVCKGYGVQVQGCGKIRVLEWLGCGRVRVWKG